MGLHYYTKVHWWTIIITYLLLALPPQNNDDFQGLVLQSYNVLRYTWDPDWGEITDLSVPPVIEGYENTGTRFI
jgi:hypothetical protein